MRFEHVEFEVDGQVGIITLDRPEAANAQSQKVLMELDQAWEMAEGNRDVKVIVLRSTGKHFSAGHDMASTESNTLDWEIPLPDALYDWETRHYLHYAKRWRDVPKPSIAAVQGKCIAAGLMLCWPCDLIVAADNAQFSDPVLYMGLCGVEYHAHTWEFGARKAKEMLFTGDALTASEAQQLGMVNKVVPLEDLHSATMALANRIARQDAFSLRMAKRAVNRTLDIQGFSSALEAVFDMHHFGHTRASVVTGGMPSIAGLDAMKGRNQEA
ncbi:enoyl-CoA hydratase [Mycobacterium sp. SMC-2]|uniref:enoyl-CoA hydratase n=1 Tax=Mycobacterium sp. SMC-2 TaxID=2857058 RepID=UPI0021B1DD89|nr:enoyl-CoA hydratase [Mycobacterium sp. SMC-2]UXA06204.1 enoyl-CoA hydratase [Mycobacterium sp. SMC-2]